MLSWKEKVADGLSRILGDSPSSSSPTAVDSPIDRSDPQAIPISNVESTSPKKSTFSSFFLPFLPTTCSGVNGHESKTPPHPNSIRPLPLQSLPRRWKGGGLKCWERPFDRSVECEVRSESDESAEVCNETLEHVSEMNTNGHGPTSHDSVNHLPYLTESSTFISENLYEFLQSCLPNIVKGCQWNLLYSTMKHGISLRTLLRRSVSLPGPCLLIVGDMEGTVFGGLLDSPLKPTAKRKYQGTNQTFVFTTIYGDPRLFRATGANRYYYLCLNDVLAFGGGGNFALRLDEDLLHGTSGPCETFGNLCLAHKSEFELKNVELWGFSHSLRQLV